MDLLLYTAKDDVRVYLSRSISSCKDNLENLVNLGCRVVEVKFSLGSFLEGLRPRPFRFRLDRTRTREHSR